MSATQGVSGGDVRSDAPAQMGDEVFAASRTLRVGITGSSPRGAVRGALNDYPGFACTHGHSGRAPKGVPPHTRWLLFIGGHKLWRIVKLPAA